MKRHEDTRPIREQLAGAERGLQQMEKTKNRDDRRVMLGCLLFDLVAIEKAMAREECGTEERTLLMKLGRRAWEIQRQIGSPIDDPSRPIGESRASPRVRPDRVPPPPREASPAIALRRKAKYWTSRGISRRFAVALARAGIESLDDLSRMTREEFFLGRGLGEAALRQCEALLGRPLPWPEEDWLKAGCPRRLLARKLVRAKILTVGDLRRRKQELAAAGLSRREIAQCNLILRAARKTERT